MSDEKKPHKKKIIQLSTSTTTTGKIMVTVLCDDGSIWYRYLTDGDWTMVKPLDFI